MASLTFFDHHSDQEHTVESFIDNWSVAFNDMNVPIYLSVSCESDDDSDCGTECPHWPKVADFIYYLPRKEHIKHVKITIADKREYTRLRKKFRGVNKLFQTAGNLLETWARGGSFVSRFFSDREPEPTTLVLYFWEDEDGNISEEVAGGKY